MLLVNSKTIQSRWTYLKRFTVVLPYVWPKEVGMQLRLPLIGLCLLANRIVNVLLPIKLGQMIDALGRSGGDISPSLRAVGVYALVKYLESPAGLNLYRHCLWLPLKKKMHIQLRSAAYAQVMLQSSDFHNSKQSGKLWRTIVQGNSIIRLFELLVFEVVPMVADFVLAVSVFWWIFDFNMVIIIFNTSLLLFWSMRKTELLKKSRKRAYIAAQERENQQLTESTLNWPTVSYFSRIRYEIARYTTGVTDSYESILAYQYASLLGSVARSFVFMLGLFVGSFFVAYQVRRGEKKPGDIATLIDFWQQLTAPLNWFARGVGQVAHDLVDAEEFVALLQKEPTIKDLPDAKPYIPGAGSVEFRDVSFSYDGNRPIISNATLHAQPGQTIAFVGKTGAGKSTLLKLLFRFYDVGSGQILVDDQDIRHVTLESFRPNVGVVPQDAVLFNDTVLNNLRYGRLDASFEEIVAACKAVALHERILSFTNGYEEVVGERGVKMSGGEIQRMAIARVFLMNPRILLLDEATSSVDSKTEMLVQESLKGLSRGRTMFVNAHRLSTIVHADLIVVIDEGTMVERGTHTELLKLRGHYHGLWTMQGKGLSSEEDLVIGSELEGMENSTQQKNGRMGQTQ